MEGPESTGGYLGTKRRSKVLKSEVVDGLEGEKQNLINNAVFYWKPVE